MTSDAPPSAASSTALVAPPPPPSQQYALVVQRAASSFAGFSAQRGNVQRPVGFESTAATKTRDSHQAMRLASLYAPAMPAEVTVALPQRQADAPNGFMQSMPTGHHDAYIDVHRQRLARMKEKWKRDREDAESVVAGRHPSSTKPFLPGSNDGATSSSDLAFSDPHADVIMPLDLPRDEFGVKIANYPDGVRFLRDGIRQCGGALPLSVIEQRISQLADKDMQAQLADIRQFIDLHKPTFRATQEDNQIIIRVTPQAIDAALRYRPAKADPISRSPFDLGLPPFMGSVVSEDGKSLTEDLPTWKEVVCPFCSRMLPGRNFARHMHSRKCVGIQLANGLKGVVTGPISALTAAAKSVMERAMTNDLDDDDVFYFTQALRDAGEVRRFRWGPANQFAPVLKAIRVIRDLWLKQKGVTSCAERFPMTTDSNDRAFFELFATLGQYQRRIPVAWIETGDIIDMTKRFCAQVLPPFPPPPRAADPRVKVTNEYPGMLFADSDTDRSDMSSNPEDEFSDDEAAGFEFAPPVRPMEAIVVAGNERETKRLNFRLQTSPPVPLVVALKTQAGEGGASSSGGARRSLQDIHASLTPGGGSTAR